MNVCKNVNIRTRRKFRTQLVDHPNKLWLLVRLQGFDWWHKKVNAFAHRRRLYMRQAGLAYPDREIGKLYREVVVTEMVHRLRLATGVFYAQKNNGQQLVVCAAFSYFGIHASSLEFVNELNQELGRQWADFDTEYKWCPWHNTGMVVYTFEREGLIEYARRCSGQHSKQKMAV